MSDRRDGALLARSPPFCFASLDDPARCDLIQFVSSLSFARPADALAGRRRAPVQKGAKAHSKKRKRKESGQGMAPPDTPVEGASP